MERFWNIVHYFAYKADYKFHLWFNKINPIYFFYKLPFAKKHFEKMGIDPIEEVNKAYQRPDFGISSIVAGGLMYVLIGLFCLGLICLCIAISKVEFSVKFYSFIIIFAISFIVNHFWLFRHDKYLDYFKEFEKMEKTEKTKWAWLSLGVILGILAFSIGSFVFMDYRL